jgi:uncharacterized RDD family membrane protein YckC
VNALDLPGLEVAPLRVRLIAITYEALLLAAILLIATAAFVAIFGDSRTQPLRAVLQLYLLSVAGCYCVWNWTGGRRTLPMRTWRLYLTDRRGTTPGVKVGFVRYLVAVLGVLALGAGIVWAFMDPERQFLHDRIAGTRLMRAPLHPAA